MLSLLGDSAVMWLEYNNQYENKLFPLGIFKSRLPLELLFRALFHLQALGLKLLRLVHGELYVPAAGTGCSAHC